MLVLGEVRHIRLIWLGRLGDLLITTPFFRALRKRFPESRIELITGDKGRPASRLCVGPDEVLQLRPFQHPLQNLALAARLLSKTDDLLIDLNTAWSRASVTLAALARSRAKVAFRRGRGDGVFNHLLPPAGEREHMLDRYARLAQALGAEYEPRMTVRLDPEDEKKAGSLLPSKRKLILIHPGNFKKFDNRWPEEKFAALTERLFQAAAADVAYLAGPGELGPVKALTARLSRPVPVLGPLPIGLTAALLARSSLVVVNATGTAHLAAALGKPMLIFLSRYTDTVWMPRPGTPGYHKLVSDSWESCREITVEAAVEALDGALGELALKRGAPSR